MTARNMSQPPRSASAMSGKKDQPVNSSSKVTVSRNSISRFNAPSAIRAPPKIYSLPCRRQRRRVTTEHMINPVAAVTGSAKEKNQLPPVARLIYSKYKAAAAKSQGAKMKGLGVRNQRGRARTIYARTRAPATNPDQVSLKSERRSTSSVISIGIINRVRIVPLTAALFGVVWGKSCFGYRGVAGSEQRVG